MLPKLLSAPRSFFRLPARGGARLAAVPSLVGGVVLAALAPRAIRSAAVRPAEPTAPLVMASGDTQVVYGPSRFDTPTGSLTLHVERFPLAVVPGRRYTLRVDNGATDGSHPLSGGPRILHGSPHPLPADPRRGASGCGRGVAGRALNQHGGGLMKQVSVWRDNTITISLPATPGSFIDLCFNATDVTPPVITISQPANKFITREAQVGVAGSVQDETATTVRVNGQPASMSGTSFTATVPLAAEGNNVIHIVAPAAAGGAETGTPCTTGAAGHSSGPAARTEGANPLTPVAPAAAGTATTDTRWFPLDPPPPALAVTAPTDGLITKQTPVTVSGT